jgi:gliding motility-associated-like protein
VLVAQPNFFVDAGPDKSVVKGYTTDLMAIPSVTGNYTYQWSPPETVSNPYLYNIIVKPTVTTTYTITIINQANGCIATDEVVVEVIPNPFLFVPNAFSPNGDGFNNTIFPIPGDGVTIKSFRIYNRWGQMVHDGSIKLAWDGNYNGEPCPIGVYSYYCEYSTLDGAESRKQGNILLMR